MHLKLGKSKRSSADTFRQVYLDITGKYLKPDEITDVLGIEPDSSCQRGDPYGKNKKARQGYWSLEGRPDGARLETQIKNIVKKIGPVKAQLRRVIKTKNVEQACLQIAVEPPDWAVVAEYYFDAEMLNIFTSLGIGIGFSLRIPGKLGEGLTEKESPKAKKKRR